MKRYRHWGTLLILVLSGSVSNASAQSHNFGYYEETYRDSNMVIYDLVWSEYVSGIENEPEKPGDFYIPPDGVIGGGGCSSAMDPECTHPQGFIGGGGEADIQSDGITDRIRVYAQNGGMPFWIKAWALFARSIDSFGGIGWEPGSASGQIAQEDGKSCNSGDQQIDGNQSKWAGLWKDSWVDNKIRGYKTQRERSRYKYDAKEQGGFLYPNGQFQNLKDIPGAILSQNACIMEINKAALPEFPPGTIFVHTHLWAAGDNQAPACGLTAGTYVNGPGSDDRAFLLAIGVDLGLVIDFDGIWSYNANDGESTPGKKESDTCY